MMSYELYYFIFLYRYVNHRNLHSFPTRRSSDLGNRRAQARSLLCGGGNCEAAVEKVPQKRCEIRNVAVFASLRSEEHTSELQSRENLVCRHLLEKKNTYEVKRI